MPATILNVRLLASAYGRYRMEPFIGQIELFAFNFAPRGWAECAGQLLAISQNTALFSLLGTTYGGDGQTSFALPDLREKSPNPEAKYYIALMGIYPSRN
jgi:microcystin-dependent protein